MGKRRKRSDDCENVENASISEDSHPPKKPRKDTNATAHRTLFVRSLPPTATSESLTVFFSQNYPLKHATVVLDPGTKQSKGYGFVTFADTEDAQKAKENLNGKEFLGRKIKIEIAEPRSREVIKDVSLGGQVKSVVSMEAANTKKARMRDIAERKLPSKLIIRNLPWSIKSPEELTKMFEKFGKVKLSTLPKIKEKTLAGFGFITMRSKKKAEKAMAYLNGTVVDGRTIAVDWAVDKDTWLSQDIGEEEAESTNKIEDDAEKIPIQKRSSDHASQKSSSTSMANELEEDDDLSNFLKESGHNLESEDEEDDFSDSNEEETSIFSGKKDDVSNEDQNFSKKELIPDNLTTLFIRNLPFTTLDDGLKKHFEQFGPIRYARVVIDRITGRPKGTGFVCFYRVVDADSCYHGAPRTEPSGANSIKIKNSILEDETADMSGKYTIEGRVLQVSRAVDRENAAKFSEANSTFRSDRDKDKRKLYLLKEGTIVKGTPLYETLSPAELKMREDSAMQRKKLTQNNPSLHLSLTRLSIRNIPRHLNSKELKALARQAVVGFATDVKSKLRAQLSKEEESRGGEEDRIAEQQRKIKGKGVVRQAKIVFEGREGSKIAECSGAGRSRGYGFVEYYSHRWALMGLRWLNGHAIKNSNGRIQRLIAEFAVENAQVVQRRKQNEEKARLRSQEVLKARERGEIPGKEKKILNKGQLMARMRKGMKDDRRKKENQVTLLGKSIVSAKIHDSKGKIQNVVQEKNEKISKRGQIIQRKRQIRKSKKKVSKK